MYLLYMWYSEWIFDNVSLHGVFIIHYDVTPASQKGSVAGKGAQAIEEMKRFAANPSSLTVLRLFGWGKHQDTVDALVSRWTFC